MGSNYALYAFTFAQLPFLPTQTVNRPFVEPGGTLTYTLYTTNLTNDAVLLQVTDNVPNNTALITGSIAASQGNWSFTNGVISWTVSVTAGDVVSLTFAVTVDAAAPDELIIANTAIYQVGSYVEVRTLNVIVDALVPHSLITSPTANQIISSTHYTIQGTAIDSGSGVHSVEIRLNGGPWMQAVGRNNWYFHWTIPITDSLFLIESQAIDNVGHVQPNSDMVLVRIDRLYPQLTNTIPGHQNSNVPIDSDLVLTFSEAVVLNTFQLNCQPGIGQWSALISSDGRTIIVEHDYFMRGQTYSCQVTVEDEANHPLQPGNIPNPWLFTTEPPLGLYLPLIIK